MYHTVSSNNGHLGSHTGSQNSEQIAFTDKSIKHLKPTEKRRVVWALGMRGLGIRISPAGTKSFVLKYDIDGQDRWITLGRYPKLSLAHAIQKYSQALEKILAGEDPAESRRENNRALLRSPTISELIPAYIEGYAKRRKRSWREDERILNREIKSKWGPRKANDISPIMAKRLLEDIVERGASVQANRTLSVGRKMYRWAIEQPDIGVMSSPFRELKPPAEETPRATFLSLSQLGKFYRKLDTAPVQRKTRLGLYLLLLTMQRSAEVIRIHTDEINLDAGVWVIPGSRTKNKRSHLVPLSTPAQKIVEELIDDLPNCKGYLFPGKLDNEVMSITALSHAVRENVPHFGVGKFTPHDFRRTASTLLGAFKVPRFDRERILNHADQSIGSVYDLYEYEDEKRAALNLWADIIQECAKSKKFDEKKLRLKLRYRDYFD